jgi:hypothetical protein
MEMRREVYSPMPPLPVVGSSPSGATAALQVAMDSEPFEAQALIQGRPPERGEAHRLPARVFAVGSMA